MKDEVPLPVPEQRHQARGRYGVGARAFSALTALYTPCYDLRMCGWFPAGFEESAPWVRGHRCATPRAELKFWPFSEPVSTPSWVPGGSSSATGSTPALAGSRILPIGRLSSEPKGRDAGPAGLFELGLATTPKTVLLVTAAAVFGISDRLADPTPEAAPSARKDRPKVLRRAPRTARSLPHRATTVPPESVKPFGLARRQPGRSESGRHGDGTGGGAMREGSEMSDLISPPRRGDGRAKTRMAAPLVAGPPRRSRKAAAAR